MEGEPNSELFVSLINVSLIVAHDSIELPILFSDKDAFRFIIGGNQTLRDHTKLFLNPYFPPMTERVGDFFFVPEFNESTEITLMGMDFNTLNESDYCLGFSFYNVDNKATVSIVSNVSGFRYDIIELSDTYYEDPLTSYAWKWIDGICLRAFFGLRREAFPDPFLLKILSSGVQSDANIFAFSAMNIQRYDYKPPPSYLVSWENGGKESNDMVQWMYIAYFGHLDVDVDATELEYKMTTKQQNRPISHHLTSLLLVYEASSVLRFTVRNKLDECLLKIKFVDASNRVLKTDLRKLVPTDGRQQYEVPFTELDTVGLNKTNKLFRVIFTFTVPRIKSDDEKPQPDKILVLSNVTFNYPCKPDSCKNYGRCLAKNGHEFGCKCHSQFAGDRCEYPNRCTGPLNDTETQTGDAYCKTFGAKVKCSPLNNDFECVCLGNDYWEQKECKKVDACTFQICGLHEACWKNETNDVDHCRCKYDYTFNEITGRCESDPCWTTAVCREKNDCIPVLGKTYGECECSPGWARGVQECYEVEENNPFPKQSLNCDHTWRMGSYFDFRAVCDCFVGYKLAADNRTCVKTDDFKDEECRDKCNANKQVCVKEKGTVSCRCKLGFYSESCVNNVCEAEDTHRDIIKFCGHLGCRVNTKNESDYRFECKCDPKFSILNVTTGKCELFEPCTEERVERCAKGNAICVPLVKAVKHEKELSSECACPLGTAPDSQGRCVDSCKAQCSGDRNYCDFDVITGHTNCSCSLGYLQMPGSDECHVNTDLVSLTVQMVMRSNLTLEGMEWYTVPDNTLLDVCRLLRDKHNCLPKYSEVYRRLYFDQINKNLIDRHIKTQIRLQLLEGFKHVIHQRPFDLWVLSYQNLTPIDYQQYGYKTSYSVSLLIASRFNEHNEVPLPKQISQKRIKEKCFRLGNQNRHWDDHTECVVPPSLLLQNLTAIQPVREDPCELGLVECPAYSHCTRYSNGQQSFKTRCSCYSGFTQRDFEMQRNDVEFPSMCQDQNECADEEFKNYCDTSTTTCENTPGSYKCNCLENYRQINAFTCDGE